MERSIHVNIYLVNDLAAVCVFRERVSETGDNHIGRIDPLNQSGGACELRNSELSVFVCSPAAKEIIMAVELKFVYVIAMCGSEVISCHSITIAEWSVFRMSMGEAILIELVQTLVYDRVIFPVDERIQ